MWLVFGCFCIGRILLFYVVGRGAKCVICRGTKNAIRVDTKKGATSAKKGTKKGVFLPFCEKTP